MDGWHVVPASEPAQSAFDSQMTKPGAGQEVTHWEPVKPGYSVHVTPHAVSGDGEPPPQQTVPVVAPVQSRGEVHSHRVEPATGHAAPLATHVEEALDDSGVSQHCWPAAHVMLLPPFTLLKGQ